MDTLASSSSDGAASSLPGPATVGSLQREPERLRQEARALQGALEELYRNHYEASLSVFIENHECLSFLQERGRGLHAALKGLTGEVAGLREDCKGFEEGAQGIVADLKRNRQTLQHHLQLVELLEVPQLMDACVRNGLYEQAVDIVGFANTLERRHLLLSSSPTSPSRPRVASTSSPSRNRASQPQSQQQVGHALVIAGLVQELRALQRQLRERLLQQLRLPIQLPRCLQVISCLRKLDGLALEAAHLGTGTKPGSREHAALELKLQAEFLEARDAWLQSVLDGRSGSATATAAEAAGQSSSRRGPSVASLAGVAGGRDPAQGLMETIEKHRTHWFEIATQFRAIFLDVEDSGVGASRSSGAGSGGGGGGGGSKVLSAWLLRRIEAFLGQLAAGLEEMTDGAALADVLEQCLFFAASMGRIGGDFRELLVPVFTRTIRGMADLHWTAAVAELEAMLERCRIEGQQPPQPTTQSQSARAASGICYVLPQAAQQAQAQAQAQQPPEQPTERGQAGGKDKDDDPLAPPASILSYPPLAQFTNLVLTSLNQLRQCTPWQLAEELEALFVLRMQAAVKALLAHREAVDAWQTAAYKLLCKEAHTVVFPYLLACFGAMVAGSTSLPAVLDRPHTQPTTNSEAAATVAAVAARVREHRAALDRLWGDAGVGSLASGPRQAAE